MAKPDPKKKRPRKPPIDVTTVPVPIVELKEQFRDDAKQNKEMFLNALFARRGNITAACEMVGISRAIVHQWKKIDPEFIRAYKYVRRRIEQHLFEQAQNLGEQGDSTLLIFSLKALNRRKFDDKFAQMLYQEKKGILDPDNAVVPVRPVLVRGEEPGGTLAEAKPEGDLDTN